jgi:hypothetical protein
VTRYGPLACAVLVLAIAVLLVGVASTDRAWNGSTTDTGTTTTTSPRVVP